MLENNLRAVRRSRDITQATLAQLIGRSQSYVSAVEKGKSKPDVSEWLVVAEMLGVGVEELVEY